MNKKLYFFIVFLIAGLFLATLVCFYIENKFLKERDAVWYQEPSRQSFDFQSIDTMKYSRDLSREKLGDESFDVVIEEQIFNIAKTGVSHVAIATPYDEEFLPILERWVIMARKHELKIWFRGNWSGWEGWFEYPKISQEEHLRKTADFIISNPDLFEDGDAFSACPECENGGEGDPRLTGHVESYRKFLIKEYETMNDSFSKIDKKVQTNLFSMNGDVAKLIMDKETTNALGGVVTVDHYVRTPEELAKDIEFLAQKSGGKIILGEFGVPIPDIHGNISEQEQSLWIGEALEKITTIDDLVGVNYWLSVGGTAEIWRSNGEAKEAVGILQKYYKLNVAYGTVYDELGKTIKGAKVKIGSFEHHTDESGYYELKFTDKGILKVEAPGYFSQEINLEKEVSNMNFVLVKENKGFAYKLLLWMNSWSE